MTYINPRLKHVKKILEIADFLRLAGKPVTAKMITNQCNLLLETKKAKKRKKVKMPTMREKNEAWKNMMFPSPDPKEESKRCCNNCAVLGVRDYKIGGIWNHMEIPTGICKNGNCECHSTPIESKEDGCFERFDGVHCFIGGMCHQCGKAQQLPIQPTSSRSEELEKVIKTKIAISMLFTEEDLHGLSEAILSRFSLTPIK